MSLKNIGNSLSIFGEGEKIKGFISSLKEYSSFLDSINAKSLKGLKSLSSAFSIFSENKELSQATQSLKALLGMMDGFSGKQKELDKIVILKTDFCTYVVNSRRTTNFKYATQKITLSELYQCVTHYMRF